MARPTLIIVAGPNGSGKTTLTDKIKAQGIGLNAYINADDIALRLVGDPGEVTRRAQRIADNERERLLSERRSLTFETVMSHESKIDYMRRAKAAGYEVVLYFVATDDLQINVERVKSRVALGGHDVPFDKIRDRYFRTLGFLFEAVLASDKGALFDNTAPVAMDGAAVARPMQMILQYEFAGGALRCRSKSTFVPSWVERYFLAKLPYVRADAVGAANLEPEP